MTKLNDLRLILLSHAAQASDGSVLPVPDTVTDRARADRELKNLFRRGLIAETETSVAAASWRTEGNSNFGLMITDAGNAAIGVGEADANPDVDAAGCPPSPAPADSPREVRSGSKIANVLGLLRRDGGATPAELVEATGWLPHTTRAALTGLKKKGHIIDKTQRDVITCYCITGGR